ncbi:MAG TPA: hypothetical protein V6C58_13035 [Allocoleopsis sp.]
MKEQTYSDIGENNGFTEGHVKDVGYELLQLLSYIFEADINKRNFKSFLEKQNNINIGDYSGNNSKIYVNIYGDRTSPSQTNEHETPEYQKAKYLVTIETAKKLRKKGLSDEEIAEVLGLRIDEIHEI